MNPVSVIALAAMGVVGIAGMSVLPPDSQFDPATPYVAADPYGDPWPLEASESPSTAPTTSVPAVEGSCPTLIPYALAEGFTQPEAELLARIGWHESRCQEDVLGDLTKGVSWGILQIHGPTWCEPSRYWPDGYLQATLIVESCGDLLNPAIAVKAARAIFLEGGFRQWSTYDEAVNP